MGAVETDEQLQQTVDKFLCPVINKLVSPFQSVRDKVSVKHFGNAHSREKVPPAKSVYVISARLATFFRRN